MHDRVLLAQAIVQCDQSISGRTSRALTSDRQTEDPYRPAVDKDGSYLGHDPEPTPCESLDLKPAETQRSKGINHPDA